MVLLTKTQARILQVFTGRITDVFSIREVGKLLGMNHSLVHRAITPLIEKHGLLVRNKRGSLSIDYRRNHDILAYVECLRRNDFLRKPRNADVALVLTEAVKRLQEEAFVLLVFGSAVDTAKPRDIDILLIVNDAGKTEPSELFLRNLSSNYGLGERLHILSISYESVYEMLSKREQRNILNEALNRHVIIHGAELFYRLLAKGRT